MVTARITLGLLVDQLVSGYARLIIAGVKDWCATQDANLIIFSGKALRSPRDHEYQGNVIFEHIRKDAVDALVVASGTQTSHISPEQFQAFINRFEGIPTVSTGIACDGIPSVLSDGATGILEAMEHLAGTHGLRRIAFLKGPDTDAEARARFEAYRLAVRQHGLDDDPVLVISGDFTASGARRALEAYLQNKGRPDFQALLAANDEMAIAAIQVLGEHGYAIPREIAIVGFDNIASTQYIVPSITTIDQSLHYQGWTAAAFAGRLAQGGQVPPVVVLPTHLILRTSCGCLPRAVLDLEGLPTLPGRTPVTLDVPSIVETCLTRFAGNKLTLPQKAPREILAALITLSGEAGFVRTFHEALIGQITRGMDISYWQPLLLILQEELIARSGSPREVSGLWAGFQKARVLLSEMLRIVQGKEKADLVGDLHELRSVMESLVSVASTEELMSNLSRALGRIDIRTCFIAAYGSEIRHTRDEEWTIPGSAEMMLAFVGGERVSMKSSEAVFSPAENFIPPALLPRSQRHVLVAESMYFREEQTGYLLFEPGTRDMTIYETFCILLSNVLKGSRLLSARQKAEERLRLVMAELEEYNQKLSGLSQTDDLTGLYNRRAFLSLGLQNLALARRMGRPGNVFFADLDGLKMINDTYGHHEGDHAIRQAGRILTETFRHMDIIARLGGDEFSVLAVDTGPDFLPILRARLDAALAAYNAESNKPYRLSMSVGAVPIDHVSAVSLEQLLSRADEILYAEKKRKKGLRG
jgi:diguanylate cyclase (GGDEF)-like protein